MLSIAACKSPISIMRRAAAVAIVSAFTSFEMSCRQRTAGWGAGGGYGGNGSDMRHGGLARHGESRKLVVDGAHADAEDARRFGLVAIDLR